MKKGVLICFIALNALMSSVKAYDFSLHPWRYEIISNSNLTVKIVGCTYDYSPAIVDIPSTVTYNGITFTVVEIGNKGCFNSSTYNPLYNATTINIPNTITQIGDSAFAKGLNNTVGYGSYMHLQTLNIESSVLFIGAYAFDGCNNLTNITFNSTTPPTFGTGVFNGVPLYAFIHIPCGATMDYANLIQLNQFTHFVEEGTYGTITAQPNNPTYGSTTVTQEPTCSSPAIIEAIPATTYSFPAYDFVSWSDGDTNNPRTLYVTGDTVISAIFTPRQFYNIAEVFDSTQGYAVGDTAYYGDMASFTAIPYHGYQFSVWKAFNSSTNQWFSFSNENPYNRVMDYSLRLRAEFTTAQYSVTVHSDGGGNVWVNGYQGDNTGSANYMSYINIHAAPNDGNRFVMWSDSNQFASRSLLMEGDTVLTAIFAPIASLRDTIYDTVYIHDTTVVYQTDTLWLHDTVTIHDTIYVTQEGIDGIKTINAKVFSSQGIIVVEGANGNTVTLYDAIGRILATKQDYGTPLQFDIPASGTYMIKVGTYPARRVVVIR